jgi:hypothetical protein
MTFESSYLQTINEIAELIVWSDGNLGDVNSIESMCMVDFFNYRKIFKGKYEGDAENKKKFIENSFDFAKKAVEVICKTIASSNGSKAKGGKLSGKKR